MAKKKAEPKVKEEKVSAKAELVAVEVAAVKFTDEVFYGIQNDDGTWQEWDPKGKPTISRTAAISLGFRRYFTGEECINGHLAPRKTKGSVCIACARQKLRDRMKAKKAEDPEYRKTMNQKAAARRKAKKAA